MFESISRRGFLGLAPVMPFAFQSGSAAQSLSPLPGSFFPPTIPASSRKSVGASHGNLARVKELVSARPALARASWDWGYGDWESAIDAASHVGNRPIAEFPIADGARPTIFTAAMMGQLADPQGLGRVGAGGSAHARSARHHAPGPCRSRRRGGGGRAGLPRGARGRGPALHGPAADGRRSGRDRRGLRVRFRRDRTPQGREEHARRAHHRQRSGGIEGNLVHQGGLVFIPAGAEAVRIRFEVVAGKATLAVRRGRAPRRCARRAV